MAEPSRRVWATVHGNALRSNLARVRAHCPGAAIYPVIKGDAYGHGMLPAARALCLAPEPPTGLSVATLDEALALREEFSAISILLLNGFVNEGDLALCLRYSIESVIHASYQVDIAEQVLASTGPGDATRFWLKLNSGMNRLGMSQEECREAFTRLGGRAGLELLLLSHLAWSDAVDDAEARRFTARQLERCDSLLSDLESDSGQAPRCSVAASAGILSRPESHYQIVRPGIMMYGSSPLANRSREELGLSAAMTLNSRLISINTVPAGGAIGYGARYLCETDTRMGVVSIGYGDGYPRAAITGTPVLLKTVSGQHRCRLLGRVSMDTITIDLSGVPDAAIDDEVELWGRDLSVDEVAAHSDTIAYELFCKLTPRVPRLYQGWAVYEPDQLTQA